MNSDTWFPERLVSDSCVSSRFSILLNCTQDAHNGLVMSKYCNLEKLPSKEIPRGNNTPPPPTTTTQKQKEIHVFILSNSPKYKQGKRCYVRHMMGCEVTGK